MATFISGKKLPWKRFWVPWDGRIQCGYDGRGFFDSPESLWGKISNPLARTIDEVLAKRCVVLSGHPGIGKTVEIEAVERTLQAAKKGDDEIFFFHCRAIATADMLRAETVSNPRWIRARSAGADVTLIIDGVDEGLKKVPEFVETLTLILKDEPPAKLRVLLVCRSAEWDIAAGERLCSLWPEPDQGGVNELCPLSYTDAQFAASEVGVDDDAFVRAVAQHRVEGLAARPITLRMLLDEFRVSGNFPETRTELYLRAAGRMCAEIDEDRSKRLRKHYIRPPDSHIFKVVGRVAAVLMLSAKNAVLKSDNDAPSANELPWRSLIGGEESVDGQTFEVTETIVEAALETAHFSFRGTRRYGFDHPTFAEFMAATYVKGLPLAQLRQLFCERFQGKDYIVPQLAEAAAWLGVLNVEWRKYLIQLTPTVLLRTDVTRVTDSDKEMIVDSLLSRASDDHAFEDQAAVTFYRSLNHPKLADQLKSIVENRLESINKRRLAIEIAGDAGVKSLVPLLWRLIEKDDGTFSAAVAALRHLAGRSSKKNLIRSLRGEFGPRANKDLAGVALQILVPKMMSVREAIQYIPDHLSDGPTSVFDVAIQRHLPKFVRVSDLPTLMQRISGWTHCFDIVSPFRHLAEQALTLALQNLHILRVRKSVIQMWMKKTGEYESLPSFCDAADTIGVVALQNEICRRAFVEALVSEKSTSVTSLRAATASLLKANDFEWLLDTTIRSSQELRQKWAALAATYIWSPERKAVSALISQAYTTVPEFRICLPAAGRRDINETLDRIQTAHELRLERKRKHRVRSSPSRRDLITHWLEVTRKGNSTGWVGVCDVAFWDGPGDTKPSPEVSRFDVTSSHGWFEMSETEREDARHAAYNFLLRQFGKTTPDSNYADAAYLAVALLKEKIRTDRKLRYVVRSKWIPYVVGRFNNCEDEHQANVAFVCKLSPKRAADCLRQMILHQNRKHGAVLGMQCFSKGWSTQLGHATSSVILRETLKPGSTRDVLDFLAEKSPRIAETVIRRLLDKKKDPLSTPRNRAVAVVALFSLPQVFWSRLWPKIVRAPIRNVKALMTENSWRLVNGESRRQSVLSELNERQLAQLYQILLLAFPPEKDRRMKSGEEYVVSSQDDSARFRENCTALLATRGTDSAVAELDRLLREVPARYRPGVQWRYAEGLRSRLRKLWTETAPPPGDVLAIVRNRDNRRVVDEGSLVEAVTSSLMRLQEALDQDGLPSRRDLWNEADSRRKLPAKPKTEEEISHIIRRWLAKDLPATTGIIVNCEVKVERFGRGRLDLKVEAISRATPVRRIKLVIEHKRCSHRDLSTACETQLVNGYLDDEGLPFGIFLVTWFGSKSGPAAKWSTKGQAQKEVETWATAAGGANKTAVPFVLDCRLSVKPAPSKRGIRI